MNCLLTLSLYPSLLALTLIREAGVFNNHSNIVISRQRQNSLLYNQNMMRIGDSSFLSLSLSHSLSLTHTSVSFNKQFRKQSALNRNCFLLKNDTFSTSLALSGPIPLTAWWQSACPWSWQGLGVPMETWSIMRKWEVQLTCTRQLRQGYWRVPEGSLLIY